MFYSFVIHKSVWSSGLCKGIPWWNCSIAAGVYATINLLICPQGHTQGLLQSLAQVRNTRVQRDKGNITVGRYKRGPVSHWDWDLLLWTQVFNQPVAEDRRGLGAILQWLEMCTKKSLLMHLCLCSHGLSYSSLSLPSVCLLWLFWPRPDGSCITSQNTGRDHLHNPDFCKKTPMYLCYCVWIYPICKNVIKGSKAWWWNCFSV